MTETVKGVYCAPPKEKHNFKINIKAANCLLCLIVAVVGVYYLTTINDLVVKSFVLQGLKERGSFLAEENKNFNNQIASLKSYNELAKRVKKLNMVAASDVQYLKISNDTLASR
ncbi:MAG: hypothetical protein WC415_00975 [Patescibacteria group bacterium]|jgi:hypothetical protein